MDHTVDNDPSSMSDAAHPSLPPSPMRKVFSLDCVRRPLARTSRGSSGRAYRNLVLSPDEDGIQAWGGLSLVAPSSGRGEKEESFDDVPSCKASKFSSVANRSKQLPLEGRRPSLPKRLHPSSPASSFLDGSGHSSTGAPSVGLDLDLTVGGGGTTTAEAPPGGGGGIDDGSGSLGLVGTAMAILQGGRREDASASGYGPRLGQVLNLTVLTLLFVATVASSIGGGSESLSGGVGGGGEFFLRDDDPYAASSAGHPIPHHQRHHPPYRYAAGNGRRPKKKGGGVGLGSAMIGTVTTALSPVLPFAGGVDLRREEHWAAASWFGTASSRLSGWFLGTPWSASDEEGTDDDYSAGASSYGASSSSSSKSRASSAAAGVPRGGGGASTAAADAGGTAKSAKSTKRQTMAASSRSSSGPVIAAADPFLPTETIADLTLGEVAMAFRYAVEGGRGGFDAEAFRSEAAGEGGGAPPSGRMVRVLDAMDGAAARSRGDGVLPASTAPRLDGDGGGAEADDGEADPSSSSSSSSLPSAAGYGDVDALQFCAAMRLLAEWRVLRQVPEGYKGYAVGMSLGHKDVVQNVAKIEAAVHDLIEVRRMEYEASLAEMESEWDEESCRGSGNAGEEGTEVEDEAPTCEAGGADDAGGRTDPPAGPRSPTLREVLQYEIDHGIQNVPKLPRLKEKSAGMGLLWVRRQLHYQTEIFGNMLLVPRVHGSAIEAVRAAYSEVYDRFHGWAVQKIFNYSFQAAPDVDVIYRHMNPRKLEEVTMAAMNGDVGVDDGYDDDGNVGEGDFDSSEVRLASSTTETVLEEEKMGEEDSGITVAVIGSWSNGLDEDDTIASTITANSSGTFDIEDAIDVLNRTSSIAKEAIVAAKNNGKTSGSSNNPWVRFGSHIASEWDKLANHVGGECDKLGRHIGGEWDKLASNVVRLFQNGNNGGGGRNRKGSRSASSPSTDVRGGGGGASSSRSRRSLSGDDLERYLSEQMEKDARGHIVQYLSVARPLLDDLAGLFDELNMDDPTKV